MNNLTTALNKAIQVIRDHVTREEQAGHLDVNRKES